MVLSRNHSLHEAGGCLDHCESLYGLPKLDRYLSWKREHYFWSSARPSSGRTDLKARQVDAESARSFEQR